MTKPLPPAAEAPAVKEANGQNPDTPSDWREQKKWLSDRIVNLVLENERLIAAAPKADSTEPVLAADFECVKMARAAASAKFEHYHEVMADSTPAVDEVWAKIERYADAVHEFNTLLKLDCNNDKSAKECLALEQEIRATLALRRTASDDAKAATDAAGLTPLYSTRKDAERYRLARSYEGSRVALFTIDSQGNPLDILIGGHADNEIDAAITASTKASRKPQGEE